jgi:hypothetical protein
VKDERESASWGLRTVNKVAGLAISRIVEAERVDVWVNTTLSKAMRGEVDAIAVHLWGFLARKDLRIETFQLKIGQVTVLPKLALKGTIQLVQPSTGKLTITLRENQLSDFLSAQLINGQFNERSQSSMSSNHPQNYTIHQINVVFAADNQLQISLNWTTAPSELTYSSTLLTTPEITSEGEAIHLAVQSTTGQEIPADLGTAILSPIEEVLSLHDFKQRGTSFQIQQLEITSEKLTLYAPAIIDQFPSR